MAYTVAERKAAILVITGILCMGSLFLFLLVSYERHIQTIDLKTNLFGSAEERYHFKVNNLGNGKYNVILKLYKKEGLDYTDVFQNRLRFNISIELSDSENNILKRVTLTQNDAIERSYAREFIEMTLLSFEAQSGKEYHLKTLFQSDDNYFNRFAENSNALFVQEDYDYAAVPWVGLFSLIFGAIFILTLSTSLIIIFSIHRDKKKQMKDNS